MSFDPRAIVERYLHTVSTGSADDVAALYAEDATLEDPVGGGEVHIGRQAIAGFYKNTDGVDIETELLTFRSGATRPRSCSRSPWAARCASSPSR